MALQSTTALATITLQSAASNVTFSGIPSTYKDLIIHYSAKHSYAGSVGVRDAGIRLNGDLGSNYTSVYMNGAGSSPESSTISGTSFQILYGMASANQLSGTIQIIDYSTSDKNKAIIYSAGMGSDSNYGAYAQVGRWANNEAVNSVSITPSGSYTLLAGSTFSLYGVIA